ncbi:hypothetical protein L1987_10870 [Smallanthus sonchifolius]|uniref:Uncharacterized protein n=1 Tax=Smallanthus sonchifolius TaxID=185202 RepID=A0ACB9JBM1_9ASTR|nr:hypothetical protein L1987_10870 [Smallanthus sonchifolius]
MLIMIFLFVAQDRVIGVNLTAYDHSLAYMTEDEEVDVGFTYSVKWKMTQEPFDKRMEKYIDYYILPRHVSVHHHSITFSSVALLILAICITTFYVLVLSKDISKGPRGGIVGKNRASEFQAPCRTAKCPKEVPQLRWYRGVLPQMALAGILPFNYSMCSHHSAIDHDCFSVGGTDILPAGC